MKQRNFLMEKLRKYPGMYVMDPTYVSLTAFLNGYCCGCDTSPLDGFRDWLMCRLSRKHRNLTWEALVLRVAFSDTDGEASDERAIGALFSLMEQFFGRDRQPFDARED